MMYAGRKSSNDEALQEEGEEAYSAGPGAIAARKTNVVVVVINAGNSRGSPTTKRDDDDNDDVIVAAPLSPTTSGEVDSWDPPTSPSVVFDGGVRCGVDIGGHAPDNHLGGPPHLYENWSIVGGQGAEEVARKGGGGGGGRSIKRWKNRTTKMDRSQQLVLSPFQQQHQQQHQQQQHPKARVPRPVLHPARKRRCCLGKVVHAYTSEGDMNQADEMGEGVDEGYTEGADMLKKRKRKQLQLQQLQQGGLHVLVPSISDGTPPSSPSGTPVSRRRSSSRKIRPKPRSKKGVKQVVPASADISTQETTTPGPGSSDTTDSPEETLPEAITNFECEAEATTPQNPSCPAMDASVHPPAHLGGDSVDPAGADGGAVSSYHSSDRTNGDVHHADPSAAGEWDTSHITYHAKPSPGTKLRNASNYGNPSGMAPTSSGTSDVETSGNERVGKSTGGLAGPREVPRPTVAQRSGSGCNSTSSGDEGSKGSRPGGPKPPTTRKPPNLLELVAAKPSPPSPSSPSQRGLRHNAPSSPSLSAHSTASPGDASPEPGAKRSPNPSSCSFPSKPRPPVAAKPANLKHMSGTVSAPNLKKVTSFSYSEQAKVLVQSQSSEGTSRTPTAVAYDHTPNGSTLSGSTNQTPSGSTDQTPCESTIQTPGESTIQTLGESTNHTPGESTNQTPSESTIQMSVENPSSPSEAVHRDDVELVDSEQSTGKAEEVGSTDALPPAGAQSTGSQCTSDQPIADQRLSAKPLHNRSAGKPLPPRKTIVRGGSEDSPGTPQVNSPFQRVAASVRLPHPPAPTYPSDACPSKPVPKPAVLSRKPAIPVKPNVQVVLSTGLSKPVDGLSSARPVAEDSNATSSTCKPVESKPVFQIGVEFKPVVESESKRALQDGSTCSSKCAEQDESVSVFSVQNESAGCKPSVVPNPIMQDVAEHKDTLQYGPIHTPASQEDHLPRKFKGAASVHVPALHLSGLPAIPYEQDGSPVVGPAEQLDSREVELTGPRDPATPPPPPSAASPSPAPTSDLPEQSSPGYQSGSTSPDSSQELAVSCSPVPPPFKTSPTTRHSPHVGVNITPSPCPAPDPCGAGRRHADDVPPPLPPRPDTMGGVDPTPGAAAAPPSLSSSGVTSRGAATSEVECREEPMRRSKSVKRFQVREEGLGVGVPRTSSSSTARRHYEEVEHVASIPRKDATSKKAAPPKPPKTYAPTDDGLSSPAGTPPPPTFGKTTSPPPPHSLPSSMTATLPRQVECAPPPLPSAPIPRKKDRISSYKRVCDSPSGGSQLSHTSHIRHPLSNNETASGSKSSLTSNEGSDPSLGEMEPYYDCIQSESTALDRVPSNRSPANWIERYEVSSNFRKSWSGHFKHSVTTSDCASRSDEDVSRAASGSLHRTTSLDSISSRQAANKIVFKDTDDSSDDGIISPSEPTPTGLPEVPQTYFDRNSSKTFGDGSHVEVYDEPLYQYINTAEFLTTEPHHTHRQSSPKTQLDIARHLAQRKLWCEQKEVMESGVLGNLSDEEKKLQEAMFEVIMSEATYLRSLDVLIEHFMDDPGMNPNLPEGRRVMLKREHHVIFSNIRDVRQASARFLADLQVRQKESLVIVNICDIILDHAKERFDCYIPYCTNQTYQSKELQRLIESNVMFRDYLKRLESHKRCQNLPMQSFLLLPMQRITRLPLLILAIFNRTPSTHPEYDLVERCLRTIQKLVTQCNDGARKLERTEQLHDIYRQMVFSKLKPFPLVSVSRQLERKGPLCRLQVEQKMFGKVKIKKTQLYVFSFTDYIFITKKKTSPKGESTYNVIDHGSRAVIEVEDLECRPGVTYPKHTFGEQTTVAQATWAISTANVSDAFLVILLDNAYRKSEKYIFVAQNSTDKTRWMESIQRPQNEGEEEKIYQHWDCPQVQALYDYHSEQPDELSLERGDIVKVFRKMADGWYEGERLRDRQWGWFPSNFTTEIHSEHTRARNLRETHKLLSLPFTPEEFSAQIQSMT